MEMDIVNRWWRPTSFKKEYTEKLIEYFNIKPNFLKKIITKWKNDYEKIEYKEFANNMPTIQWFCRKLSIDRHTLYNRLSDAKNWKEELLKSWEKVIIFDKDKQEFLHTFNICKEIQEQIWMENSLKWLYNPSFSIFFWKNVFKWKDKVESETTIKNELLIIKTPDE